VGANVVGTIVGFGLEFGTEDSAVVVVTGEMVGVFVSSPSPAPSPSSSEDTKSTPLSSGACEE
jgi:hypothetical protein